MAQRGEREEIRRARYDTVRGYGYRWVERGESANSELFGVGHGAYVYVVLSGMRTTW